jgi:hypothetical protein
MPARVIQNFGVFWERAQINWGTRGPGNAGHLKGYLANPKFPVDFREQRGIHEIAFCPWWRRNLFPEFGEGWGSLESDES